MNVRAAEECEYGGDNVNNEEKLNTTKRLFGVFFNSEIFINETT